RACAQRADRAADLLPWHAGCATTCNYLEREQYACAFLVNARNRLCPATEFGSQHHRLGHSHKRTGCSCVQEPDNHCQTPSNSVLPFGVTVGNDSERTSMKFRFVLLLLVEIFASLRVPAQDWVQTSAPITNWSSIACSADGA